MAVLISTARTPHHGRWQHRGRRRAAAGQQLAEYKSSCPRVPYAWQHHGHVSRAGCCNARVEPLDVQRLRVERRGRAAGKRSPARYIILYTNQLHAQQSSGRARLLPLSLAAVAVAVAAHAQSEHPCSALAGSSWWLFAVLGATSRRAHQMLWPAQLAVALCHNTPRGHAHGRIEY